MTGIEGLALAVALATGAGPGGVPSRAVLQSHGRALMLDISADFAPSAEGGAMAPLSWRRDGAEAVGEAQDGLREVQVRLSLLGAGVVLEARVRYLADVSAEREAVRLRLRGPVRAVAHDLGWRTVGKPVRVDRGTPVVVAGRELAIVGGPGIVAARVASAGEAADVELVLDDEASHPFAVYERCLPKLPEGEDGQVTFAALEHKRPESRTPRRSGEEVRGRATLYPLAQGSQLLPLVVERWPAGARAAVVFTDHADRTDPEALRAVLYGDSRPFCRPEGPGGFLGRGVRITKSFFVHARRGALEEPETAALARELAAAGSEVASHSPSPGPDDRDAVAAALPVLRRFGVATWIDHEPYTNCEALSAEGWRSEGPYAVHDLLAGGGFLWVWAAGDVGGFAREPAIGDLFAPGLAPALYPLPFDRRLWAFGSTMFQGTPEGLGRALSDEALDRLEADRGLFVAHTYLAAAPRTTTRPDLLAKLVVREVQGGLELHPAFDEALSRIAERARAGTLASLTWEETGTRLRALGDLGDHLPRGRRRRGQEPRAEGDRRSHRVGSRAGPGARGRGRPGPRDGRRAGLDARLARPALRRRRRPAVRARGGVGTHAVGDAGGARGHGGNAMIRPLAQGDIPALAAALSRLPLLKRYRLDPGRFADDLVMALERGDGLLVEERDQRARGLAWLVRAGTFGAGGYLKLLAVVPEATGEGIGAVLLAAFEAEVARESRHAFLLVSDFNDGAQRFYERHGYARVGELPGFVLPEVAEVVYWKRLR